MIKRSSLGEPSPKRRRVPAAALRRASTTDLSDDESTNDVLSLSQVYDTRLRRRIKRSVLGEEMDMSIKSKKKNTGSRTRKGNIATAAEVEAEVQRLRAELAGRDAEIERLQNETMVHDTERIMELEQQIEALRTELAQRQLPVTGTNNEIEEGDSDNDGDQPSRSFYDWTLAARDPFSDSYLDESDDFRDVTMEDVACSTPSRRKSANPASSKSASASFPTPPCTSPTMPATPCSVRRAITPVTPPSHVGIQASLPDPEKEALEAELGSLRLELTKLTNTLESHAALQDRLAEKLSGAASVSPTQDGESSQPELEEHVNLVLQKLSDRTAALLELSSSLSALGFAGSDASEMIASIASGFRAARLELEYLTPGEITLPLSSHGAEVLDLVLTRLRDMARKGRKDDDAIDEYHALELSLRQQLSARVDAMEGMRHEQKKNATVLRERDDRIAELEFGLDRLKGAAEGYRRDIVELESLVQRLEGNEKATEAKLQADLQSTQAQLSERTAVIADLEAKLASTLTQADELETKLKDLQRRKDAETKVRNKSHGAALALRDARVLELRREIYGINESVRNAHETIRKLRVENGKLERKVDMAEEEKRIAKETVDTMKAELEKVTAAAAAAAPRRRKTRSSSSRDNGPATPDPEPGSFLSGDLARSGAGKGGKKRRYDSGLGFLDEEEDEVELLS
jgi:DNA repair exonuclease SbcCD ATPase subunit